MKAAHAILSGAAWQETRGPSRLWRRVGSTNLVSTAAYPTLYQERKEWGTPQFSCAPYRAQHHGGFIDKLFLLRKPQARSRLGQMRRKTFLWYIQ
jgi:hypothetical protein